MAYNDSYEVVWQFSTDNYTVTLVVTDEDMDPDDQFSEQGDVDLARQGGWNWFAARVQVLFGEDDEVVGSDYLGGCSYHSLEDFKRGGYFHDMVNEALREARHTMASKILLGVG